VEVALLPQLSPFGHTWRFSGSAQVHSGSGNVIKDQYRSNGPGFEKKWR
jgi:hypothetical protein